MSRTIISVNNLVKNYGNFQAVKGISFEVMEGEIFGLLGPNGAGKSTLIKCLSGAEVPESGTITLDGNDVNFKRPQDGRAAGIETVYQTLAVAPALDIASNLFLGRELRKKGPAGAILRILDSGKMKQYAKDEITKLGIGTIQNISQAVETLSGGQRQAVSVARAAAFARAHLSGLVGVFFSKIADISSIFWSRGSAKSLSVSL